MNYAKSILYGLLILFIILISIVGFLLTTTPGLYTVIKLVNFNLPGSLHVHHLHGRLIDHAGFSKLSYADDTIQVDLYNADLHWTLRSLLHKQLTIKQLHADKLIVQIKDTPKAIEKTAEVDFSLPQLPFELRINELSIDQLQINQVATTQTVEHLKLQAAFNNDHWSITQLDANYANFHLSLQAKTKPSAPYSLSAQLNFEPIIPQEKGLKGSLTILGDFNLYHWKGQFTGPVKGELHGSIKNGFEVFTEANWHDVSWPIDDKNSIQIPEGKLTIQGNLLDLHINAKAKVDLPVKADWHMDAYVKNNKVKATSNFHLPQGDVISSIVYDDRMSPKLTGEISTTNLNLQEFGLPLSQLELKTSFRGESAQTLTADTTISALYLDHLLRIHANYEKQTFKALFTLGPNTLSLKGNSTYQWQATASLPQPSLLHPSLIGLATNMQAKVVVKNPQEGNISLTIAPGIYHSPQNPSLPAIKFQGGQVNAKLNPKSLFAKGVFTIDKQKIINLSLRLPNFRLDRPVLPTQTLDGKINLHIDSLDFLQGLSEDIEKLQGKLNLNLIVLGTVRKPEIDGTLALTNASLFIPVLNLNLNPIQATLKSQNKQWTADALIGADGQKLTLVGQGDFSPIMTGALTVQGENFPFMKTAEYTINISPQLTINFKPEVLDITGTILVPSAELKPVSFSSTLSLNEDAVFASDKKTESVPLKISTDIMLKMGQSVALNVKGLKGFLDGAIQIKQFPQGEPFGIGELTIRDGKYQAYGQDLTIERGQLMFTGGMLSNPGIVLRAARYFKNATTDFAGSNQLLDFNPENLQNLEFSKKTTVGVDISGRLSSPKVTLFSTPSNLSQADILSMIILGKPASQASKSGGQLLLTALSSMNLDSGTKGAHLLDQLKEKIGFDFNVESTSQFNQTTGVVKDSTSFVVGKAISKRLYLSYNIGLFETDSNVLTLKYLLNKFFSIQVSASDSGSGIDFLYNHSKE